MKNRLFFHFLQKEMPTMDDNVFISGYLRQELGANTLYLNPRYTYKERALNKWLQSASGLPFPYLFANLNGRDVEAWSEIMRRLWKKTLLSHGLQD